MQNSDTSMIQRLAIVVIGRVQGVGFRFFTKETADMYSISGWVRNCFNGTVEIEAQGNRELMRQFIKEVKKGPMFGHVSELKIRETRVLSDENLFTIRY